MNFKKFVYGIFEKINFEKINFKKIDFKKINFKSIHIKFTGIKKINWKEILAAVIVAVFAGMIIIPTVAECIKNGKYSKCNSTMYILMETLSQHLSAEDGDGKWHDMILNGKSDKALEMLIAEELEKKEKKQKKKTIKNIDLSEYYFERSGNVLYLRCRNHVKNKNRSILLDSVPEDEEKDFGALGWNSNTERKIADIDTFGENSFIVDAGTDGKYCIDALSWEDCVLGDNKIYGPAIVFCDDVYYYYPDGFKVNVYDEKSSPAYNTVDPEDESKSSYGIVVDTSSVSIGRFSSYTHEGSLMIEDNELYIWQTRPSKTDGKGWIKILCDYKKL